MKIKPTTTYKLFNQLYDKNFTLDIELSDNLVKVYTVIDKPNELIIIHYGNNNNFDWHKLDSLKDNILKNSKTFKLHKKRHQNILANYPKYFINVIGCNRTELFVNQLKHDQIIIYKDDSDDIIEQKPFTDLIGTEIFKKEINFKKIRINELKTFLKNNKKNINLDINLTGLTKNNLIEIIETVI